MIVELVTIEGLGGTGKTHAIQCECNGIVSKNSNAKIVYLTYNRAIVDTVKERIRLSQVRISTLHALIYQELLQIDELPSTFDHYDEEKAV